MIIEADRRAYANIINAPDAIAGQELVAAHREAGCAKLREALVKLRDCNWVISLPDRMDAVRDIARQALGDH